MRRALLRRPYMWAAYMFAALYTPLCIVKLLLLHFPHNPLPAVLLLLTSMGFTVRRLHP